VNVQRLIQDYPITFAYGGLSVLVIIIWRLSDWLTG
jgi:hypothetical protein